MDSKVIALFRSYVNLEYSVIPNKKFWDEKKKEWTGKLPAISGWNRFCTELATNEDVDEWESLSNVFGISIVTGEASNLMAIDLDTEDPELQAKIKEILPYTPIVIKGNPKRGGKYIYRLTDMPASYVAPPNQKVKISDRYDSKKTVVDILMGNSYICIPPSLHSIKDNITIMYEWADPKYTLENVPKEHIPVFNLVLIDQIQMIVAGQTKQQVISALPPKSIDLSNIGMDAGGRWKHMTALAGKLVKDHKPVEEAVEILLYEDATQNPSNPYFLDKTKGCKAPLAKVNAFKMYCEILYNDSVKTVPLLAQPPRDSIPLKQEIAKVWRPIIPLENDFRSAPFDPEWMPAAVRDTVMRGAEVTAVPPQAIFFYMLSTFSSLLGNKIIIQPYHLNTEYTESNNLYVGIVAKSGERKTETTKIARKALMKIQEEEKSRMAAIMKDGAIANENIEIKLEQIRKDIEKEIKAGGIESEFVAELRKDMGELEQQRVQFRKVSLYEQYATAEKYYEIVEQNPYGIFLEFNEWGAAHDNFYTKGNEKFREFIMNGWDGQRPFSYRTKRNGENEIEKLCLSVGFCVQEDVMSALIWRVMNISKENDGLIQRFMLILSDDKIRPVVDKKFIIPDCYYAVFRNAYNIPPSEDRLLLELKAYDSWLVFQEDLKRKEREEPESAVKSFLAKYSGMVIRMASNLEHMNHNGNRPTCITYKTYRTAENVILYLESNMRAIFKRGELLKYNEIIDRMEMSIIEDGITVRSLTREHQTLFGNSSREAMVKLKVLHDHNYIRIVRDGKSYKIFINPSLTESN